MCKIHTITDLNTKAKDTHQSGGCPESPYFIRFFACLKQRARSPSNALPCRALSFTSHHIIGSIQRNEKGMKIIRFYNCEMPLFRCPLKLCICRPCEWWLPLISWCWCSLEAGNGRESVWITVCAFLCRVDDWVFGGRADPIRKPNKQWRHQTFFHLQGRLRISYQFDPLGFIRSG